VIRRWLAVLMSRAGASLDVAARTPVLSRLYARYGRSMADLLTRKRTSAGHTRLVVQDVARLPCSDPRRLWGTKRNQGIGTVSVLTGLDECTPVGASAPRLFPWRARYRFNIAGLRLQADFMPRKALQPDRLERPDQPRAAERGRRNSQRHFGVAVPSARTQWRMEGNGRCRRAVAPFPRALSDPSENGGSKPPFRYNKGRALINQCLAC
jgi:hypothetical protein